MAVKIKPIFPYELRCPHCMANLIVEKVGDILVKQTRVNRYPWVKCPSCEYEVRFQIQDTEKILNEYDNWRKWR